MILWGLYLESYACCKSEKRNVVVCGQVTKFLLILIKKQINKDVLYIKDRQFVLVIRNIPIIKACCRNGLNANVSLTINFNFYIFEIIKAIIIVKEIEFLLCAIFQNY